VESLTPLGEAHDAAQAPEGERQVPGRTTGCAQLAEAVPAPGPQAPLGAQRRTGLPPPGDGHNARQAEPHGCAARRPATGAQLARSIAPQVQTLPATSSARL